MKPGRATIRPDDRRCRGTVLIVTMVIVFALSAMVVVLGRSVRVEATATANAAAVYEADAIVRGAEQYLLGILTDYRDNLLDLSPDRFEAVPVGTGFFWVFRPDFDDPGQARYGLVDEAGKLHLNAVSVEALRRLPGMTDDLAASIVTWRSSGDTSVDGGADSQVYLSKAEPYQAKNSPFETVEELLLVHGMTRELLYGRSAAGNGNGGLGMDMGSRFAMTGRAAFGDRYLTEGLFDYFTIWNTVRNRSAEGRRRININNQGQRNNLRQLLRDRLGQDRGNEVAERFGQGNFADLFDFASRTGMTGDELLLIEDYITTTNAGRLRGRINVLTAPRDVLLCLEELSAMDVERLLAARGIEAAHNPGSIAWIWEELGESAIGLGNRIIGQGQQYSADIVAISGNGRAFKRVRIVFDASRLTPRVLYRRDITDRGWPLDVEIRQVLREGRGGTALARGYRWGFEGAVR